jgi:hypothetical protein
MNGETQAFVLQKNLRVGRKMAMEPSFHPPEHAAVFFQRGDVATLPAVQPKQANARHRNMLAKIGKSATADDKQRQSCVFR